MAIRLTHSVIPVSVKLGAPARVSARSSLPFSVGDWRGVSTFSGARPSLVSAKVKLRAESTEEDRVPIDDDDSTDQLVSVVELHLEDSLACAQNYVNLLFIC